LEENPESGMIRSIKLNNTTIQDAQLEHAKGQGTTFCYHVVKYYNNLHRLFLRFA
jgi:hypothetical protein